MHALQQIIETASKAMRERIVDYLLTHNEPSERTQVNIMRTLGTSQATVVKYLAELKGQGLVIERPLGTAVVYEIQYDVAINQGLAEKYKIFDLDSYLAAHGQQNQEWKGKVFKFGGMVYIFARHINGFTIGIPIYDKEWRELVEAIALGLNLEGLLTEINRAVQGT